jgi:hypothetical protein
MVLGANELTPTNSRCLTHVTLTIRHQSQSPQPKTPIRYLFVNTFVEAVVADGCPITCPAKS